MKLRNPLQILLILMLLALCCGFTAQQQKIDKIPNSNHPLWDEFAKCRFVRDELRNLTMIGYTPEVRRLNNKTVTISGFITPLEPDKRMKHFLLGKLNPTCAFCPPSKPYELIEVSSSEPIEWTDQMVTLSGRFELTFDGQSRIFFFLKNATKL